VSPPLEPHWFKGIGIPTASVEDVLSLKQHDPIKSLRRQIRTARRNVPAHQAQVAAEAIANALSQCAAFCAAQHIAAYLAFDGELDPAPLLSLAQAQGKQTYLPVLQDTSPMVFAPLAADTAMAANRFGIPEPVVEPDALLSAQGLDLVLTPLVAFDDEGFRLGMGGGFYDRTFAFKRTTATGPLLLGVAYALQERPVPHREWDIPLDGVITEQGIRDFSGKFS